MIRVANHRGIHHNQASILVMAMGVTPGMIRDLRNKLKR